MHVKSVINYNQTSWQEVSMYWNDQKSKEFYKVVLEMESMLNNLDKACEKMDSNNKNILARLNKLENL